MSDPGGRPTVALIPPSCCGAGYFRPLRRALGERVEVRTVELPGHGRRHDEPRVRNAAEAADDLGTRIGDVDAVYGESLGAYLALAVLGSRDRRDAAPVLVAASNSPPSARDADEIPADLATGQRAVAALRAMGGEVPPEVLADTEEARDAVALIRDDLRLSRSLVTHLHDTRVSADIVVLAGRSDRTVRVPATWAAHTSGTCTVEGVPGGHLLSAANPAAVADAVTRAAHDGVRARVAAVTLPSPEGAEP